MPCQVELQFQFVFHNYRKINDEFVELRYFYPLIKIITYLRYRQHKLLEKINIEEWLINMTIQNKLYLFITFSKDQFAVTTITTKSNATYVYFSRIQILSQNIQKVVNKQNITLAHFPTHTLSRIPKAKYHLTKHPLLYMKTLPGLEEKLHWIYHTTFGDKNKRTWKR